MCTARRRGRRGPTTGGKSIPWCVRRGPHARTPPPSLPSRRPHPVFAHFNSHLANRAKETKTFALKDWTKSLIEHTRITSRRGVAAASTRRCGARDASFMQLTFTLCAPQIVEDILSHAEEIAVSEGGPAGEVTLLRLLKVPALPHSPAPTTTTGIATPSVFAPQCRAFPLPATLPGVFAKPALEGSDARGCSLSARSRPQRQPHCISPNKSKIKPSPARAWAASKVTIPNEID